LEHTLAADADEPVPARGDRLPTEMDVDVVPVREFPCYNRGGNRIIGRDVLDREVGEDHAPSERHSGRIALEYFDLVARIAKLHRDGEIEARRPRAAACDFYQIP